MKHFVIFDTILNVVSHVESIAYQELSLCCLLIVRFCTLNVMEAFQVVQFEKNNAGDAACKEIFHESLQLSQKKNKPIKSGKILKKSKNKGRNTLANKQKIRNVIKNIDRSVFTSKYSDIKNKTVSLKKDQKKTLTKNVPLRKNNNSKSDNTISHRSDLKVEKTTKFTKEKQKRKKHHKNKSTDKKVNSSPVQQDEHINTNDIASNKKIDYKQRKREKFKEKLQQTIKTNSLPSKQKQTKSLREKMMERLQAARFRYINEQIYSSNGKEAQKFFTKDPESFRAYHEGYKQQVNKWPLNPVDVIIKSIQKMPKTHVIADFGCGDAKLAKSVEHQVHSFDLVATDKLVTACDMARVPLQNNSVDVAVFCLSLMGTNLQDYILEANRVLKVGGILKVAEVESRFEDVQQFVEGLRKFNFKNTWKDLSHNLFYFLDFKKESNIKNKKKLPSISLNPCLYKKR